MSAIPEDFIKKTNELSEEVMLGSVVFGHEQFQPVIDAIIAMAESCAKEPWDLPQAPDAVYLAVSSNKTIDAVRQLAAIGVGGCVCFASGASQRAFGSRAAAKSFSDCEECTTSSLRCPAPSA